MTEQVIKHLEDIDQVLCDTNANMGNVVGHLGRIAAALEALVQQCKQPVTKPAETTKKPVEKVTKAKKEAVKPVEEKETVKVYTHDDLKHACLTKAREDGSNRDKLKALLKEYDAVKAVDVPEDKLAEVIGKIEAGDF